MRTLLLILFIVFGGLISLYPADLNQTAAADHAADSVRVDSSDVYFEDLTHLLSLRLFTLTKSNTLEIISEPQGRIILEPNGNTNLGLGFNYKFLGLSLSFGLAKAPSSVDRYGQTNSMDVQVSVFGKRIGSR